MKKAFQNIRRSLPIHHLELETNIRGLHDQEEECFIQQRLLALHQHTEHKTLLPRTSPLSIAVALTRPMFGLKGIME